MIVCDFQARYGIELETSPMLWSRFQTRLLGLLADEASLLYQRIAADLATDDPADPSDDQADGGEP